MMHAVAHELPVISNFLMQVNPENNPVPVFQSCSCSRVI